MKIFIIGTTIIILIAAMYLNFFIVGKYKSTAHIDAVINASDSVAQNFKNSTATLDSLAPIVAQAILKVKAEQSEHIEIQKALAVLEYKQPTSNTIYTQSNEVYLLRSKLNVLENDIAILKIKIAKDSVLINQLRKSKTVVTVTPVAPVIFDGAGIPNENSIIVTLNTYSNKNKIVVPNDLTAYLIPVKGNKHIKRLAAYDMVCNENTFENYDYTVSTIFNGKFIFNNVESGKYLIKICAYVGGYKFITKQNNQLTFNMDIAPPLQ